MTLSECSLDSNVFKGSLSSIDNCPSTVRAATQNQRSFMFILQVFQLQLKSFERDSLIPISVERKSFSMINIHTKSPSPRSSLTVLDVHHPSNRPRSSLGTHLHHHILSRGGPGHNVYSFHWRRRSTSFLQPRWVARKFR